MKQEIIRVIQSVVEANNDKKLQVEVNGKITSIRVLNDDIHSIYLSLNTTLCNTKTSGFYVICNKLVIEESEKFMWLWLYDKDEHLTANTCIWYKDMEASE